MADHRTAAHRKTADLASITALLVAVHFADQFDGGFFATANAEPRALKAAIKLGYVTTDWTHVELTDDGRVEAITRLQADDVDPEDREAIAEWAATSAPRVEAFFDQPFSAMELHAIYAKVHELIR